MPPQSGNRGNTGNNINVAVLDSGVRSHADLKTNNAGGEGLFKGFNAIDNLESRSGDSNGHGTIVSSIISNKQHDDSTQFYYGVAPDSNIVPIRALDDNGIGSYSNVIRGIQWVIDNKSAYNIRVMNLSLTATPQSYYWDDPLNQAVMAAWQAGIVVVVAAGNGGPDPMSIGVPGNNPYVITVGAITDAYTVGDLVRRLHPALLSRRPDVRRLCQARRRGARRPRSRPDGPQQHAGP